MTTLPRHRIAEPTELDEFVRACWEQRACRLEAEPLLTPAAAFELAARYGTPEANEVMELQRVWVDGNHVFEPRQLSFLVRSEDKTFAGWADRCASQAATRVFGVSNLKAQVMGGWPLWDRLVHLLGPLFTRTGLPYGGVEAFLLSGSDQSVLPVLHSWSFWDPDPHSGHFILAASGQLRLRIDDQPVVLEEGGLAYVSAAQALDGALDGLASALVINVRAGAAEACADRIARELLEKGRPGQRADLSNPDRAFVTEQEAMQVFPRGVHRTVDVPERLPEPLVETAATLLEYSTSEAFAIELCVAWQVFETSFGFAGTPEPSHDREPQDDQKIAAVLGFRWLEVAGRLFVAGNGHVLRLPNHPAIRALLSALSAGETGTAEDLAARHSDDDGDAEQLFELIQKLYQQHIVA